MSYSRREALAITVQKKRECNTKALRIVESMLDEAVDPDWLLDNLQYISQSHFQDAIEERAISKQCGYPLCDAQLGNIPSQQFHISVKTNKVYDITERKHFCSNLCYKAAHFLKEQLLTSPVWLRDMETIPAFKLLPLSTPKGNYGKEVQFDGVSKPSVEPDEQPNNEKTSNEQASNEQPSNEKTSNEQPSNEQTSNEQTSNEQTSNEQTSNEQTSESEVSALPVTPKDCSIHADQKRFKERISTSDQEGLKENQREEVVDDIVRENHPAAVEASHAQSNCKDVHNKPSKRKSKTSKNKEKPLNHVSFVGRIEKCFSEWFTIDSLIFLHGTDKAKDLVKDRVSSLKNSSYYSQMCMDPVMGKRYTNLCKKLNILEIEDNLESDVLLRKESKPLPNLEQLREDAKVMEIKVREFYKGSTMVSFKDEQKDGDADSSGIPLVDTYAQNALRRRIILDRLQHILPDLLRTLGMTSTDISEDVRGLFTTFSLKADNITFKPAEWNLIGLIVLKM
ncbi:putative RNA polymerase II subunit B1 CTD phosphatase RPAP2 [Hetaerina americana]|uniref:putative RNA polymerase II subunit B1 CTD phosphatase RPAP2 n=1 Tax=Hetaerina americana TaxID=62018 RepID=UPI003A7F53DA